MADYTIQAADGADTGSIYTNEKMEHLAVQLVLGGGYNGTTSTATLQESNDKTNWVNIVDSAGDPVQVTLTSGTTAYMMKTGIWYGKHARVNYAVGDATTGTVSITSNVKQ